MDGDDVTPAEHAACMRDLAQVNVITLARRPTLAFIDRLLRAPSGDPLLTIMDVGFGGRDILRMVHQLARRHVSVQVRRAMMLQRATESPLAMALGMGLFRLRPGLLGALAKATRLPAYEIM